LDGEERNPPIVARLFSLLRDESEEEEEEEDEVKGLKDAFPPCLLRSGLIKNRIVCRVHNSKEEEGRRRKKKKEERGIGFVYDLC
jgi:hypothetical protein